MQYLVIDVGPHFNGEATHMSKEQIFIIFGIDVSQPEFDSPKPTPSKDQEEKKERMFTMEERLEEIERRLEEQIHNGK